eukprot:COSAG04_NODE_320_length_16877_cov_26.485401_4_plen_82_part_00
MRLQQAIVWAGAFVSGAEGLRFESNDCSRCLKGECHQDPHGPTVLKALATGPPPDANQSFADARVQLNVGAFAEPEAHAKG